MNGGKIVQLADPHTIYERPADRSWPTSSAAAISCRAW